MCYGTNFRGIVRLKKNLGPKLNKRPEVKGICVPYPIYVNDIFYVILIYIYIYI